jgi:protein-S-isoprenylcysteine O-methyltransferase
MVSIHLRPLPFTGATYSLIFWCVFAIWVISEIIASRLKRSDDASKANDRGSLNLILLLWWLGMALNFLLAEFLPEASIRWRHASLFTVGIGLMLAGIAFRWYCVEVLGKYFTFDVTVKAGHALIEAGPYRYIRHPSYTGALVTIIGFGLALGNWAGLIVFLLCIGIAYAYRIPVEEALLTSVMGQPYREYVKRTWRLIPFVF